MPTAARRGRKPAENKVRLFPTKLWEKTRPLIEKLQRSTPPGQREPSPAALFHMLLEQKLEGDGQVVLPGDVKTAAEKAILDKMYRLESGMMTDPDTLAFINKRIGIDEQLRTEFLAGLPEYIRRSPKG